MNSRIVVSRPFDSAAPDIFAVLRDPQGHVAIDATGMLQSADGTLDRTVKRGHPRG